MSSTDTVTAHDELEALRTIHAATRVLLRERQPQSAIGTLARVVERLGGRVVSAGGDHGSLAWDLACGLGPAFYATAPEGSVARALLEQHLPALVADVTAVLGSLDRQERRSEDAATDPVTGLRGRSAFLDILGGAEAGDSFALVQICDWEQVLLAHGRGRADEVLRAFARALSTTLRDGDHTGRLREPEFGIVFRGQSPEEAARTLDRVLDVWELDRPVDVIFSSAIEATVPGTSPIDTLRHVHHRVELHGLVRLG